MTRLAAKRAEIAEGGGVLAKGRGGLLGWEVLQHAPMWVEKTLWGWGRGAAGGVTLSEEDVASEDCFIRCEGGWECGVSLQPGPPLRAEEMDPEKSD